MDRPQRAAIRAEHVGEDERVGRVVLAASGAVAVAGALSALGVDAEDGVTLFEQPGEQRPVVHLDGDAHRRGVRLVLGDALPQRVEPRRVVRDRAAMNDAAVACHQHHIVLAS